MKLRDRVILPLKHREPDRIPIDPGMTVAALLIPR